LVFDLLWNAIPYFVTLKFERMFVTLFYTIGLTISPPCIKLLKIYSTNLKFWI